MHASPLFEFDRPLEDDSDAAVLKASLTAQDPETIRTILSASETDLRRELDFVDRHIRGNAAAQRVYGAFVEQLERPKGCEAVLSQTVGLGAEERALLLDHYLVVAHRLAEGFRDRVRKCSN